MLEKTFNILIDSKNQQYVECPLCKNLVLIENFNSKENKCIQCINKDKGTRNDNKKTSNSER
jgi:hypothetical protein